MRIEALQFLACPSCKHTLALETGVPESDGHILNGGLRCQGCASVYSIVRGVPRLLLTHNDRVDTSTGEAYADYFGMMTSDGDKDQLYGKSVADEIDDFIRKLEINGLHQLTDAVLVDAGCGMARIEGALTAHCRAIVAFDVTPVVELAFNNWRPLRNVHLVQGSLTDIPAAQQIFDVVWCDGALPYVSDVWKALDQLTGLRNETGIHFSWCYGPRITFGQFLGRVFHLSRLPLRIRYIFILTISALTMAATSLVRFRNRLPATKSFAEGVLDLSLSGKVNHVSATEVNARLKAADSVTPVSVTTSPNGQVVMIRQGKWRDR